MGWAIFWMALGLGGLAWVLYDSKYHPDPSFHQWRIASGGLSIVMFVGGLWRLLV